jgi:hypothetical protein
MKKPLHERIREIIEFFKELYEEELRAHEEEEPPVLMGPGNVSVNVKE